jgi:hypothetical protein
MGEGEFPPRQSPFSKNENGGGRIPSPAVPIFKERKWGRENSLPGSPHFSKNENRGGGKFLPTDGKADKRISIARKLKWSHPLIRFLSADHHLKLENLP